MPTDAYKKILEQILHLSPEERLQLREDLKRLVAGQTESKPRRSIMESEGFAKDLWKGVDVQKYIDEERDSWEREIR